MSKNFLKTAEDKSVFFYANGTENKMVKSLEREDIAPLREARSIDVDFQEWTWRPKNGRFILTIRFSNEQKEGQKTQLVRNSLEEALLHLERPK